MIFGKKCMVCDRPATHKFVKIDQNQVYDLFYCEEHAAEKSPYQQKSKISLNEILANFLNQEQPGTLEGESAAPIRCEQCGTSFASYRKTLMLGCGHCYESFAAQLQPELRKFHGNIQHVGRRPGGEKQEPIVVRADPEPSSESTEPKPQPSPTQGAGALVADHKQAIEELTRAMNEAIAREDFEKAALCRDQIRELKEQLS